MFKKRTKPIRLESIQQLDDLVRSGRPVLVDFWQQGCSSCGIMDGIVKELAQEFDGQAHVVMANAAVSFETFERYKVRSTPTFIVFTAKEGANTLTQRFRASGLTKKDVLVKALQSAGSATKS